MDLLEMAGEVYVRALHSACNLLPILLFLYAKLATLSVNRSLAWDSLLLSVVLNIQGNLVLFVYAALNRLPQLCYGILHSI